MFLVALKVLINQFNFLLIRSAIKINVIESDERQEVILIWLWDYLRVHDKMEIYFFQKIIGNDSYLISSTLHVLWIERNKYGRKFYYFMRQIAETLSKHPTTANGWCLIICQQELVKLISNMRLNNQFWNYQILKEEMNPICWENRYCLLFLSSALALSDDLNSSINFLIQFWKILRMVDTLTYQCRNSVLTNLFQHRFMQKVLIIKRKKRYFFNKYYLQHMGLTKDDFILLFDQAATPRFKIEKKYKNLIKRKLHEKMKNKIRLARQ